MKERHKHFHERAVLFSAGFLFFAAVAMAQAPAEKTQEKVPEKSAEPPNPAQIELLETKYRFETNGDSRKEVHALVKINSELGVRQFARLNFDYNRSFQSVEIPLAHITHANGGTSDTLPSAITDAPNPAVEKFPAYHDVRVKSVRILGLQPGDSLEYRVITITTKHPLAPNFYFSHDFANDGLATTELFEVDLPASLAVNHSTTGSTMAPETINSGDGVDGRVTYRWRRPTPAAQSNGTSGNANATGTISQLPLVPEPDWDAAFTSFPGWGEALLPLQRQFSGYFRRSDELAAKAAALTKKLPSSPEKLRALYDFVRRDIATVELPLGSTGFRFRSPEEVISSGYAIPEEKCLALAALAFQTNILTQPVLVASNPNSPRGPALPSIFTNALVVVVEGETKIWLDPATQVAPFGMIAARLRGKPALLLRPWSDIQLFATVPTELPFLSAQGVFVHANLDRDGKLSASVKYALRGDNELLLRATFHQIEEPKQKELAQYLALSDGFRGKVTSVKTSDPYDTDKPFEVEYELTQEKFVDWSKKPVRIPALLPLPGLPEAPKKQSSDARIDLGPPLNIELTGTLRLPAGTTAVAPPGTSVKRDYATFSSEYSAKENVLHFSRHLNFVSSELPGVLAVDLSAFLHAVQSDQSQLFVLDKPDSVPPAKPK